MITDTDLIIKDSNIYHLGVNKEQISTTIILVGDPDRVEIVSKYFDRITHKSQHREFVVHSGYIGDKYLTVLSTGIGTDNIDIVINELDALFNIDFKTKEIKEKLTSLNLIRLGTCGSLDENIGIDTCVVSDYGLGLDNLLSFYGNSKQFYTKNIKINHTHHPVYTGVCDYNLEETREKERLFKSLNPYLVEGDVDLRNLFPEYTHGITVTCPGFYGPQGRNLRIQSNMQKLIETLSSVEYNNSTVTNFEMETSALYGLSKLSGHKALTICTVVGNRITNKFSKNAEESVDKMIRNFLEKIVKYVK
jgi:uridine phosphorylase